MDQDVADQIRVDEQQLGVIEAFDYAMGRLQGEITQTREDLNRLLATTGRSALPFELRRKASRERHRRA